MKELGKIALAALCAALCFQGTRAGQTTAGLNTDIAPVKANTLKVDDVPDPGFVGHPLIAKYGYQGYSGKFRIEIGEAPTYANNLTDDDPDNYERAIGVGVTLALDHLCSIVPKPESDTEDNITPPKYHAGDVVGFVLSDGSNAGSVLNLDLIKMFAIYLYNDGELVATVNAQGSELDVLGLSLISYGAGMQTVELVAPETDSKGNPLEFDGVGLGTAGGVDLNVIEELRIHYAYIDNLVEVPIIKRYFHDSSAATQGMVTGAKNLVNNNLNDGATTAVLNIGGAYYDVYAGEPIPTGVEAGFTMTSGTALNLDLGKAVRMQAIVKDASGNYKTINLTTGFDVVGLQVAGGGATEVSTMIPSVLVDEEGKEYKEFWGLRLERISGVDLDLGATVVHYAYVKLPKYPEDKVPYLVNMYILPGASYEKAGVYNWDKANYHAQQTYTNKLLLRNSTAKPLLTQKLMPNAYRKGGDFGPSRSHDYAMMSLFRSDVKDNGKEDIPQYVGAISIWTESDKWYYAFQLKGQDYLDAYNKRTEIPGPDENGVIDFGAIELDLAKIDDYYKMAGQSADNIVGFNYWLYVHESDISGDGYKNMDEGYELDYSAVVVPQIVPSYEIAGVHTLDYIKGTDINAAPHSDIKTDEYQNYIEVIVPDLVDYKTAIDKVTVYRHNVVTSHENEEIYKTATLTGKYQWAPDGVNADFNYIHKGGACKLVFGTEAINSKTDAENYYTAVVSVKLSDAYAKELDNAFPTRSDFPVDAEYGWVPSKAAEHIVPELVHQSASAEVLKWSSDNAETKLTTTVVASINDAALGHANAGDILYTQWAKVSSPASSQARALAPSVNTVDGEWSQHTAFNENDRQSPSPADMYYTSSDKSAHTATLYAYHALNNPDAGSVNYDVTTRAYVPVLPSGLTAAQMAPSYLVTEAGDNGTIDKPIVTGVENVEINDEDAEAEYFNLQGVRVAAPQAGHVYIMRRGSTAAKVLVK